MKRPTSELLGDASFRRLLASPAARREIAESYVAYAEQGLRALAADAALWRSYPEHVHNLGRSGVAIAEVRRALALAEALLSPLAREGTPNHRARAARPGAISPQGTATIAANARRPGGAGKTTAGFQAVAQVSRPRTCV